VCRIVSIFLLPVLLTATKYAGEFQELGVDGRACAMGGTGVAQYANPSVIYFNPAGSYFTHRGISLMHAENFAGIVKNEFGSVTIPQKNMSLGVGIQYLSVGDIKFTSLYDTTDFPNSNNRPYVTDTVGTKDMVVYLNGAKGNDRVAFGANVKVFYRNLSVITGYGGGLDVGAVMNLDHLIVGITLRDFVLSPILWSNGTKETIITKVAFGVAPIIPLTTINSGVVLACDVVKPIDIEGFDVNLGFEYTYKDVICGRIGIYRGNYTFGAGLQYRQFNVDYALVTHSELANSNKISAGYRF